MRGLSDNQARRIATRAQALGDTTRVRIVHVLAHNELSVGRIAAVLRAEPSSISKHLQVLFREGLVSRRRAGAAVLYTIADADLVAWCRYLSRRQISGRANAAS
jgi:ArsR family transcriptional regulator